ncbi:hypothetical protein MXD60_18510, partial [Frankia sp. AgB32]
TDSAGARRASSAATSAAGSETAAIPRRRPPPAPPPPGPASLSGPGDRRRPTVLRWCGCWCWRDWSAAVTRDG